MATVSNSSPLILYAKIDRLALLQTVFGELLIPAAVYREVVVESEGRPGARLLAEAPWVRLRPSIASQNLGELQSALDPGEAEAIALALELGGGTRLLMDETKGRQVARAHGLRVVGSAGVLVLAKEQSAIPLVRPLLESLRTAGLYLGDTAYATILALARENQGPA